MAILRIKEINSMSSADRAKKLSELRAELARLRTMVRAGGAVENPTRIHELRKTVAQILTIENEKKLNIRQTSEQTEKAEKEEPKAKEKKEKQSQ